MNEIDVLVNAGLSRTNAELVAACFTMASALVNLGAQQQSAAADAGEEPTPVVSGEVVDVGGE